jgi:acetolactate synthase-1/2/3 large subunit
MIIGGPAMGRARRWQAVEAFSQLTGIPALVMESPRGVHDPWLHGAAARLAEADAALLLGKPLDFSMRFGAAPAFAAGCRFLTIGPDAVSAASSRVSLALAGDPETAMKRLVEAARGRAWAHHEWGETVRAARRWNPPGWDALRRSAARPIHPLRVAAALQPWLDRGATLVCDGGEFGQWIQAGVEAPVRLINGLSGSIGSAIPMACGARLARGGQPAIAVVGDGTFGFHAFELDTAVRHGLPVVVVVGNDARWNAEHQLQLQHYGAERTVGCELLPSRYDKLAEALGAHGEHVERPEDLEGALRRAIASGRAACINVMIEGAAAPTYTAAGGNH